MIEHPTFHSAQDDEMRRGVSITLRAHRHFERSREISIAERSLSDEKQHQYVVSPQCIRADYCSAVEIEGYARDDATGNP